MYILNGVQESSVSILLCVLCVITRIQEIT